MKLLLSQLLIFLATSQMANSQVVVQYQTRCPITASWLANQNCSDLDFTSNGVVSTSGKLLACTWGTGPLRPAAVGMVTVTHCANIYLIEAISRKMPADVGNRIESTGAAFNLWGVAVWTMNDWVYCDGTTWTNIPPMLSPC